MTNSVKGVGYFRDGLNWKLNLAVFILIEFKVYHVLSYFMRSNINTQSFPVTLSPGGSKVFIPSAL